MLTDRLIHSDFRELATAQTKHEQHLLALPNVVGVGLGTKYTQGQDTGKKCLSVLVDMKLDKELFGRDEVIPTTLDSIPTDVYEVGVLQAGAGPTLTAPQVSDWMDTAKREREQAAFQAVMEESGLPQRDQRAALSWAARAHAGLPGLAPSPVHAARMRPAIGGVSIGHYRGTAGTLGICCYDASSSMIGAPQRFYVLSNNHVLANCNDAAIGDPILQPAPADGGQQSHDTIAWLSRFVPIKFTPDSSAFRVDGAQVPVNYVDAAIAEGRFDQLDRRIHWIGDVRAENPTPQIGITVHKCGRASRYTTATVATVNTTVHVGYPNGRVARFAKQIICHGLSTGGDSGAVVTDLEQRAIGLLFATSPVVSVLNPMPLVEQLLGIRIAQPIDDNRTVDRTARR
jgi:hypothetical protein